MPRYFFHLRDGQDRLIDDGGRWVDDPSQLGAIALREARALIAQDVLLGRLNLGQRLEVEDERGAIVHVTQFRDAVEIAPPRDNDAAPTTP